MRTFLLYLLPLSPQILMKKKGWSWSWISGRRRIKSSHPIKLGPWDLSQNIKCESSVSWPSYVIYQSLFPLICKIRINNKNTHSMYFRDCFYTLNKYFTLIKLLCRLYKYYQNSVQNIIYYFLWVLVQSISTQFSSFLITYIYHKDEISIMI